MREYEGEVAFLSIAGRDDVGAMRAFVEEHGMEGAMPHIADLDGELWSRFGVGGQPTFVFVGADGELDRVFGAIPEEELERRLEALEDAG